MSLRNIIFRNVLLHRRVVNFLAVNQERFYYNHGEDGFKRKASGPIAYTVLAAVVITNNKDKSKDVKFEAGEKRPDLPTYRADEVSKHDSKSSFWVTYKNGVYDVTSFLPTHPGGEQILNAAGLSVEPFWNVYGMHKTEEVFRLLESYRIGNLHPDDICDHSDDEMWAREPSRNKALLVKTSKPFNAETPPDKQIEHFDTPNDVFFVRQHMPVPEIDPATHRIKVVIDVDSKTTITELSLQDLEQFEKVEVEAALMCAGNRRSEMNKQVRAVKGLSWGGGAVSNARWGGVPLRAVLQRCGLPSQPDPTGPPLHVVMEGCDIDATGTNFSTSIPLHMALDPNREVLLVTEMNGGALPADHGFPLRALVPGAPAVRSVKWLHKITVSTEESPSHWHQKDYRSFNASTDWDTAHFPSAPPVYSLPVTSAICNLQDGGIAHVEDGFVTVKGYAYSGGGAKIVRVDVSGDEGKIWRSAHLAQDSAPAGRHHAWTLWTLRLPVHHKQEKMEIWVKATDSNFNTQPEEFKNIWNIRGILSNAYHKITVNLVHPK